MVTPCPTWRPPWWLWVKPWATSSGVWGLRTIIQSFFSKVSVKCKSYPDVMSRCGQTPHSWHSWVKTRISKIFKFVYFHHFEWALHCTGWSHEACFLPRVGRDTINNSLDTKMKSEMPKSLTVIETAAEALAMASSSLKSDPYSKVKIWLIWHLFSPLRRHFICEKSN